MAACLWHDDKILHHAAELEGHPDNAAACWLGGFVTSLILPQQAAVQSARFVPPPDWHAVVVLPSDPVSTSQARAVLPDAVSRTDAVANIQRAALLTAAFAQGRGDWLSEAMSDRLHQPYRFELCPLLPRLLPLAGTRGVLGVALSGAGPAVLCIAETAAAARSPELAQQIQQLAAEPVEIVVCALTATGARDSFVARH